ncbi:MAG: methylmalonyl Co-A mutase-associated GTPase MeaB [Desulfobulbaceae bacterium]
MNIQDLLGRLHAGEPRAIGRAISLVEEQSRDGAALLAGLDRERIAAALLIGMTGPPGAGKSTLTGGLVRHLRGQGQRVGIVAVDPSSPLSGGAVLGDRIRMMDHALDREVVVRSMATRGRLGGLSAAAGAAARIMAASGCTTVLLETVGVGQSEMDIVRLADLTVMVLAPGFGDEIQAMKAGILEVADLIVVNKADQPGSGKLALDLAAVFARAEDRDLRLHRTVASEDQGIDVLLARIDTLVQQYRKDGTLHRKREQAFTLETLDWAQALLRPKLAALAAAGLRNADPRLAAEEIIIQLQQEPQS